MSNTAPHNARGERAARGLQALTRWVLAHKRLVAGFWIVLTLAGMLGASRLTDALDDNFTMPPSEAFATNAEIEQRFSSGGPAQPLVVVAELPPGESDPSAVGGFAGTVVQIVGLVIAVPAGVVAARRSSGSRAETHLSTRSIEGAS